MDRNELMKVLLLLLTALACAGTCPAAPKVSFSFDDPHHGETPLYTWEQRNNNILNALEVNKLRGILFVCGKRIDSDTGRALLSAWDNAGHLIANHSYSHFYYHSRNVTVDIFEKDFYRCDSLINGYENFIKLFRYPYLKEGDNEVKRDYFRDVLLRAGYANGHVSIDASDWYIDGRLIKKLKENPQADITAYKEFFLKHILERATYYNELSKQALGREASHVLLLHHNLLNSLFLNDLIQEFKGKGWEVINTDEAYKDEVYNSLPGVIPAGESIIWSLAKASGKFESRLRYPAEDGKYEEAEMDKLGL
jgi:peptidoglycan/xylan/chitin deacetylase (PgdA/CDA1 family)